MAIESASREKLLLMFYEEAIKSVKKALLAFDENKIEERCKSIGKAYDIILELNNTLDHKVGGQIALDLESLYMFIMDSLIKVNVHGKRDLLEDVLKILINLYEGWIKAIEKTKGEKELKKREGSKDNLFLMDQEQQD